MSSVKELFAVRPKDKKNFIALNVKNIQRKQPTTIKSQSASKQQNSINRIISKEKTNVRSACPLLLKKTSSCQSCHSSCSSHSVAKAYRNAACQTININEEDDSENNDNDIIRYPSSNWEQKLMQNYESKSIALQTNNTSNVTNRRESNIGINTDISSYQKDQHNDNVEDNIVQESVINNRSEMNSCCDKINNDIKSETKVQFIKKDEILNNKKSSSLKDCTNQIIPKTSNSINFIKENSQIVGNSKNNVRKINSTENKTQGKKLPGKYKRGVVPRYITEKKIEKEKEHQIYLEEAEKTGILDPECPPGHILLPNEKRLEQLEFLNKNYKRLISELNTIPVRNDSLKIRHHRMLIEKELDKMEEAIRLFSKEKLFIKP